MSNDIFPAFPGLAWGISKTPVWATTVSDSASGRQYALAKRLYPLWHFKLPFEVLRAKGSWQEWEALVGFINARRGRYDDFLYQDLRDCTASSQGFGVGDGSTRSFALLRSVGGFSEPVGAVDAGSLVVKVAGVATAVTLDAALSTVTFASAPASGALLNWSGTYYYRCRFAQDEIAMEQFMQDLWTAKSVEFRTFRP